MLAFRAPKEQISIVRRFLHQPRVQRIPLCKGVLELAVLPNEACEERLLVEFAGIGGV